MTLGENIRRIRLERSMTQAALAEALGVSDRAVSRWERNAACPDITLLTSLAMVLETSADALLGIDPQRIQDEILQATQECSRLLNTGDASAAVALMRKQNSLYPNQPELMVYLARALTALHTEAAAREALALCRAANGREMRLSTTFGSRQIMAQALHQLGKDAQAAQLIEDEMPAIWVSRELLLPRYAGEERARRIRRSNVTLLAGLLTGTLRKLGADNPAFTEAAGSIDALIRNLP